jgi:predicted transcriptional regulator
MYDDLPEEVREQLAKASPSAWMSTQILAVLQKHGALSVDDIIANLWRDFKKVGKRTIVHTRLQDLCSAELVVRVRRGYYKLPEAIS